MGVENGDMMRYAEVETGEDWRKPWLENTEEPEIEPDGSWYLNQYQLFLTYEYM